MPGEGNCFLADPFHQTAVSGNHIGIVIDDILETRGLQPFGKRHANGHGETLPERTGGGFNAAGVAEFGMTCSLRAKLAEIFDLIQRHILVAGEIEQGVEQHRAMTGGQDKAVPVGPIGFRRIEFEKFGEEDGGDIGHPHRHAGMAGVGGLDGVHGQGADGVRHVVMLGRVR